MELSVAEIIALVSSVSAAVCSISKLIIDAISNRLEHKRRLESQAVDYRLHHDAGAIDTFLSHAARLYAGSNVEDWHLLMEAYGKASVCVDQSVSEKMLKYCLGAFPFEGRGMDRMDQAQLRALYMEIVSDLRPQYPGLQLPGYKAVRPKRRKQRQDADAER